MDFKAAFDSIDRYYIWKAFSHYGLPCKYIRIIQAFFNGTVSAVRQNGELSEWFEVSSGSGQGDIQGPPLFMSASMSVNDRDSRRREIPAPGELFLPGPGRFSIFAGNLAGNF